MMLYTNDDIQEIIEKCNANNVLRDSIMNQLDSRDRMDLADVLSDGWVERFDRYDSALCENFLTAYENTITK